MTSLKFILARSIILLSCSSSGGTLVAFEYGWSYRKNSNACNFVFLHRFIHKKFRMVRGPVFYPVSSFRTSDGPIEKIFMQVNFFWCTGSFGNKIFRMVRGPVFCPVSGFCTFPNCIKKILINSNACNFVFLHRFIHKKFRMVRGPVFYPVSGFCTSDGPIEKISFETLLIWLITLYIFSDLLRGHSSEKDFQAC